MFASDCNGGEALTHARPRRTLRSASPHSGLSRSRLTDMSWAIAGDWLAVAGLSSLTFGTAAQALGNLAEFKDLQASATKAAIEALAESTAKNLVVVPIGVIVPVFRSPAPTVRSRLRSRWGRSRLRKVIRKLGGVISYPGSLPGSLKKLREQGGDDAVKLARYLRAAKVWAVLTVGSALVAASAVIQLVLAYQATQGAPSSSILLTSASAPARARTMTGLSAVSGSASVAARCATSSQAAAMMCISGPAWTRRSRTSAGASDTPSRVASASRNRRAVSLSAGASSSAAYKMTEVSAHTMPGTVTPGADILAP
jgi:hypothetical protein